MYVYTLVIFPRLVGGAFLAALLTWLARQYLTPGSRRTPFGRALGIALLTAVARQVLWSG